MVTLLFGLAGPLPARADAQEAGRCFHAAQDAAKQGRQAEAAVLFQRAIDLDPSQRMKCLRELADALSLSDRARQAIPLYREVLAAKVLTPQETTWARLGLARALAYAGKSRQAVLVDRAVLAGGSLSANDSSWARHDLAQYLAWSSQYRAALQEYDALIRQDPKDIRARRGRAEVLSWMGRMRAARKEYETALHLDSGDTEAQWKLAQLQNWRSEHREARRRIDSYLHDHPDDPDASRILAEYYNVMGRPDEAMETLHDFMDRHSQDSSSADLLVHSRQLLEQIRLNEQPDAGVDYQSSTQSDHLDISVVSVQQNAQLQDGRTTLGPRYQRYDYSPPRGQIPITVNRPGIFARRRLTERSELTGNVYIDLIEPERQARHRRVLTYDTYYTLWPSDRFRIDLGSRRLTFDNVTSLTRGISATYGDYSIDYLPDERTRLTTRGDWGAYSDGNSRRYTQVEMERRVARSPHLALGARFTDLAFSRLLNNGYYNPSSYRAIVLTFHLWADRGKRLHYDFDGSYGREHANPGGGKPFSSLGGRVSYLIGQRMWLEGRWQFFSSRQASGTGSELSSSGFARHTVGIFLRVIM